MDNTEGSLSPDASSAPVDALPTSDFHAIDSHVGASAHDEAQVHHLTDTSTLDDLPIIAAGLSVSENPATELAPVAPRETVMSSWKKLSAELVAGVQTLFSAGVYATLIVTFGFQVARVDGLSMGIMVLFSAILIWISSDTGFEFLASILGQKPLDGLGAMSHGMLSTPISVYR